MLSALLTTLGYNYSPARFELRNFRIFLQRSIHQISLF